MPDKPPDGARLRGHQYSVSFTATKRVDLGRAERLRSFLFEVRDVDACLDADPVQPDTEANIAGARLAILAVQVTMQTMEEVLARRAAKRRWEHIVGQLKAAQRQAANDKLPAVGRGIQ